MTGSKETNQSYYEFLKEKGALLAFTVHGPQCIKKARDLNIDLPNDIHASLVNIYFTVFPKIALNAIRKIESEIREFIRDRELRIGIRGLHYIPKDYVFYVIEEITRLEKEYENTANEYFIDQYDELIEEMLETSKGMKNLIPSKDSFRGAFYFQHNIVNFDPPDENQKGMLGKYFEQELSKFHDTMKGAYNLAKKVIRDEMIEEIEYVVDRLGKEPSGKRKGEKKIFRDSMVEKFQDFWKIMHGKNIFKDKKLEKIISEMEKLLKGKVDVIAKKLRDNDEFRKYVCSQLEETKETIKSDTQ